MKSFTFILATTIFIVTFTFEGNAQKASSISGDQPPSSGQKTSTKNKSDDSKIVEMKKAIFDLLNNERTKIKVAGVEKLIRNDDLDKVAQMHTDNMANNRFFSHKGLDGLMVNGRADSVGFKKWNAIGENIAFNRGFDNPCKFAVSNWMESPAHRENLLNERWKLVGIGISQDQNGTFYFNTVFVLPK